MDEAATILELSDRLVAAQRPIRILDAIKWDDATGQRFLASGGERQPEIDAGYYQRVPLGFDPAGKRRELAELDGDVVRRLGTEHPAGRILRRMCREYELVVSMLEARGTPAFARLSVELFGRADEPFHHGGPSLVDLADLLDRALTSIDTAAFLETEPRTISGDHAVAILAERLGRFFAGADAEVRVCLDDGIVADAAAGSDYIKLRRDARFGERDLAVLEAHEGWVHVGTTLNGMAQRTCTFLAKGTPTTTITQEGLALLVEVLSFRSHPARLRRVTDRIHAIHLASGGASFVDVFRHLVEQGRPRDDAYVTTVRVFRGSVPDGGPFTKDLAYSKGFIDTYNFLRLAVRRGRLARIPLLLVGKVALEELPLLAELAERGLISPPRHVPPPLADLTALSAWMAYSGFMNLLDLDRIEREIEPLLA